MSPARSLALEKLSRLDKTSSDFDDKLCNTLYLQEYSQHEKNFREDDLVWLIDYLDEALRRPDLSLRTSRKCRRELRSICGARAITPTSYILSSQLLTTNDLPFASGGSADLFTGTFDGSTVCVKRVLVYPQNFQKRKKEFCEEAVVWKNLDHPNILPLLGITTYPLQLVSKWVSGGDMWDYIERHPDADRRRLLCDIAEGLHYLHSRGVIHGSLKGSNILVEVDGRVLIAGFGLANVTKNLDSIPIISFQKGFSLRWAAPEVLEWKGYSKKVDIFSFAMVMIEIFTGATLFSSMMTTHNAIEMQGERPPRPATSTFTDKLWGLTQRCWDHDPELRPEALEVLEVLLTTDIPAWKRLTGSHLSLDERLALISSIFSESGGVEAVMQLSSDDAQEFVDVTDEVLDSLQAEIRRKCLYYLSRICGHQSLLPKSLLNPPQYDLTETAVRYRGEIASVAKGICDGRAVAVKVLSGSESDLDQAGRRFYEGVMVWKTLHHPNILPLMGVDTTTNQLAAVYGWMDNGNVNEFTKVHPDANRLELLADVAKGLIYLHDQGIVHGNLNGSNILIDDDGHACLAGFNLLTITPDKLITASSDPPGKTNQRMSSVRWPAPEVLEGVPVSTKADIFSFAMLIIEVFTGTTPFNDLQPISSILQGERPQRPTNPSVTGGLWESIQQCWGEDPHSRPEASEVLQTLLDSSPPA